MEKLTALLGFLYCFLCFNYQDLSKGPFGLLLPESNRNHCTERRDTFIPYQQESGRKFHPSFVTI
jgi:hypothetical protein